jgi:hypothetical protein
VGPPRRRAVLRQPEVRQLRREVLDHRHGMRIECGWHAFDLVDSRLIGDESLICLPSRGGCWRP